MTLSGTLTLPGEPHRAPFRAIVLVSGSGPQNRDSDVAGFKLFAVLADHLTRNGIVVLRYDDRGVGGSTGRLATSTLDDLTGDVVAAVTLLATRTEIDVRRIGILGHSQGAHVAALAANQSPNVAFLVCRCSRDRAATSSAASRPTQRSPLAQHPSRRPPSGLRLRKRSTPCARTRAIPCSRLQCASRSPRNSTRDHLRNAR